MLCVCDTVNNHAGVLLMDEVGAVGLDLSFASHVVLMEPVLETDLQQQVVARAWRLGSQQPVHMVTYIMGGGSIEEVMVGEAVPKRDLRDVVYQRILKGLRRVGYSKWTPTPTACSTPTAAPLGPIHRQW